MQVVVSFPIFYTIYQQFSEFNDFTMRERSTHGIFLIIYSICGSCFIIFKEYIKNEIAMVVLVGLIFMCLGYNWWIRSGTHVFYYRYFVICLALFGLGFGCWILDQNPNFCIPEHWLQFHALWHVLTAVAIACLYLYLRTEEYQ